MYRKIAYAKTKQLGHYVAKKSKAVNQAAHTSEIYVYDKLLTMTVMY